MKTNIAWAGIACRSMEHCAVEYTREGMTAQSTIVGYHEHQVYTVNYTLRTNLLWETCFAEISVRCNSSNRRLVLEKKNGQWWLNGVQDKSFSDCLDIDISLTPFTNTLPVRRIAFPGNEPQLTAVVYIDILQDQVLPVKQFYSKLSPTSFRYENFDKQFAAEITVNKDGLVTLYPGLFIMTCEQIIQ